MTNEYDFVVRRPLVEAPAESEEIVRTVATMTEAKPKETPLPNDLKASLALLKQAEEMPTRNDLESSIRDAALRRIRAHVFALQQGLPHVSVDANAIAASAPVVAQAVRRHQLEILAREHAVVRELIAENDELRAALKAD